MAPQAVRRDTQAAGLADTRGEHNQVVRNQEVHSPVVRTREEHTLPVRRPVDTAFQAEHTLPAVLAGTAVPQAEERQPVQVAFGH